MNFRTYYIHGYNSTGLITCNGLRDALSQDIRLVSWDADKPFEDTLKCISAQIDLNEPCKIIASSFGGYFAVRLGFGICNNISNSEDCVCAKNSARLYLVNPLINPRKEFLRIMPNRADAANVIDTYVSNPNIAILRALPITVFLAQDDEVLDYRDAFAEYKDHASVILYNGGHVLKDYAMVANVVNA